MKYFILFFIIFNSCSKKQLNNQEQAKNRWYFQPAQNIFPSFSVDYFFDSYYFTPILNNFNYDTKNTKITGTKAVGCATRIDPATQRPVFPNSNTYSNTTFTNGVGNIKCPIDLSEIPSSSNGTVIVYLDIVGVNGEYAALIYKKAEFSPLIQNRAGFTTKSISINRNTLQNENTANISIPYTKVIPSPQINNIEKYTLVALAIDSLSAYSQLFVKNNISGSQIQGTGVPPVYNHVYNLAGFKNAGKIIIKSYLVNMTDEPEIGINKTIALDNQVILVN